MGTHPIFESDFDCLTEMLRNFVAKVPKRGFFGAQPLVSVKDQIDMFGPTSIRKIEYETFEAGFDIFAQYDDNMPIARVGEEPKKIPSKFQPVTRDVFAALIPQWRRQACKDSDTQLIGSGSSRTAMASRDNMPTEDG